MKSEASTSKHSITYSKFFSII